MQRYIKSDFDVTLTPDMLYNPNGDEGTLKRFVQRRAEEDKAEKAAVQPVAAETAEPNE